LPGNRVTVVGFGTFLPRKRSGAWAQPDQRQGNQDQRQDGARVCAGRDAIGDR
jgi:hypothetical protein